MAPGARTTQVAAATGPGTGRAGPEVGAGGASTTIGEDDATTGVRPAKTARRTPAEVRAVEAAKPFHCTVCSQGYVQKAAYLKHQEKCTRTPRASEGGASGGADQQVVVALRNRAPPAPPGHTWEEIAEGLEARGVAPGGVFSIENLLGADGILSALGTGSDDDAGDDDSGDASPPTRTRIEDTDPAEIDVNNMSAKQLAEMCANEIVSKTGNKPEVVDRLLRYRDHVITIRSEKDQRGQGGGPRRPDLGAGALRGVIVSGAGPLVGAGSGQRLSAAETHARILQSPPLRRRQGYRDISKVGP